MKCICNMNMWYSSKSPGSAPATSHGPWWLHLGYRQSPLYCSGVYVYDIIWICVCILALMTTHDDHTLSTAKVLFILQVCIYMYVYSSSYISIYTFFRSAQTLWVSLYVYIHISLLIFRYAYVCVFVFSYINMYVYMGLDDHTRSTAVYFGPPLESPTCCRCFKVESKIWLIDWLIWAWMTTQGLPPKSSLLFRCVCIWYHMNMCMYIGLDDHTWRPHKVYPQSPLHSSGMYMYVYPSSYIQIYMYMGLDDHTRPTAKLLFNLHES
jgi:hypothetical protein